MDVEGADGRGAGKAMGQAQSMVLALDNDNARLGGPCGAAASRLLAMGQAHHTSHDTDCRGRHRAARHGQHSRLHSCRRRAQGLLHRALRLWHGARLPWSPHQVRTLLCFISCFIIYYYKFIVCWSEEDLAMPPWRRTSSSLQLLLLPPSVGRGGGSCRDREYPPELTAKRLHVPLSGRRGSYSAVAN